MKIINNLKTKNKKIIYKKCKNIRIYIYKILNFQNIKGFASFIKIVANDALILLTYLSRH